MTAARIFKTLSIIHIAICIGTAIFLGVIYTLRNTGFYQADQDSLLILELIVPIAAGLSFLGAYFFGKSQYKKLNKSDSLETKLNAFKVSNIVLWASLEGSALFGAVSFLLTGRMNLFLYGLMLGVLLIYFRPLKSRAVEYLDLTSDEADELHDTV